MKKKPTFKTATGPFNFFKDDNGIMIGTVFMDDRDKQKQMMPDRAFKKDIPRWNL